MSDLFTAMADHDIIDTLRRLGKARTAEGVQIHELTDHALSLVRNDSRPDGLEDFGSWGKIEDRANRTLECLIKAQLLSNRRTEESYRECFKDSGPDLHARQKEVAHCHNPSMMDPPKLDSSLTRSTQSSLPGYEQARDPAAIEALSRKPPTSYTEQNRRAEGFHPWPERSISREAAVNKAHEESVLQRKSIFLYMAERRQMRAQANHRECDRFYQGSGRSSNVSGSTSALNKLFDNYRGGFAISVFVEYQLLT